MLRHDRGDGRAGPARQARPPGPVLPRPRVPEPERGQQVKRRRLGPAVGGRDPDQDVVGVRLRVLDGHVPVAALVEGARLEQLELGIAAPAAAVLLHQARVRIRRLRVLVQAAHVRVRRRRVEVEVVLLHVLAVIALRAREPEVALLQDGVALVPQRHREAEPLVIVRDAEDAVLAPAIRPRARVVVREGRPTPSPPGE